MYFKVRAVVPMEMTSEVPQHDNNNTCSWPGPSQDQSSSISMSKFPSNCTIIPRVSWITRTSRRVARCTNDVDATRVMTQQRESTTPWGVDAGLGAGATPLPVRPNANNVSVRDADAAIAFGRHARLEAALAAVTDVGRVCFGQDFALDPQVVELLERQGLRRGEAEWQNVIRALLKLVRRLHRGHAGEDQQLRDPNNWLLG